MERTVVDPSHRFPRGRIPLYHRVISTFNTHLKFLRQILSIISTLTLKLHKVSGFAKNSIVLKRRRLKKIIHLKLLLMQTINFTKCKTQYTERDCSFMLLGDCGIRRDLSLLFCLATRGRKTNASSSCGFVCVLLLLLSCIWQLQHKRGL